MGGCCHNHANEQRTKWAAWLIASFMLVEVVGGLYAGSLALLADAAHMTTDALSLGFAWWAFKISRWPANPRFTYGFSRMQVLAGFTNGIFLLFVMAWIGAEAVHRFYNPQPVMGTPMLVIAFVGLLVNLGAFAILHGADQNNPNIRGAVLHVMGDLLGSVAALVAAGVILATGWLPIDPILSLLVCLILLKSAWGLIKDTAHILLEGAPKHLHAPDIAENLKTNIPEIAHVHHIHVWSLTAAKPMLTLHARIQKNADVDATLAAVHTHLRTTYHIHHATVQLEGADCPAPSPRDSA